MAVPHARLAHLQRALHQPVTLYEHNCCGRIRWSGARCCDQCGARSDIRIWNISLGQAMARLHRHDVAPPAAAKPAPAAEQQPPAEPEAGLAAPQQRPILTSVRPPGVRPHRWDGAEEQASAPVPAVTKSSGVASPAAAVGCLLTSTAALILGASIQVPTAPLIGIAAILIILFVPLIVIAREEE